MRTFLRQICLRTGFIDFPAIRLTYNGRYIAKLWCLFLHSLYSSYNLFLDIVCFRDWKPAVALRWLGYVTRGCLVLGRWPCSVNCLCNSSKNVKVEAIKAASATRNSSAEEKKLSFRRFYRITILLELNSALPMAWKFRGKMWQPFSKTEIPRIPFFLLPFTTSMNL